MDQKYYTNNNVAMPEGDDIYADPETIMAQGGYGTQKTYAQHPMLQDEQDVEESQEEEQEDMQEQHDDNSTQEQVEEEQSENAEDEEEIEEEIKQTPTLSKKEMHFKELRNAKKEVDKELKRAKKEAEVLRQRMIEQQNYYQQYGQAVKAPDLNYMQDGDFLQKKDAQTLIENQRAIQEQMAQQAATMRMQADLNALRAEYHDFDQVVSTANIEILKQKHPALAHSLGMNNDWWSRGVGAYTLIKQFGIHNNRTDLAPNQIKGRIEQNVNKPRASQSLAKSSRPLQQTETYSNGLTEQQKQALLDEVYASAKRF